MENSDLPSETPRLPIPKHLLGHSSAYYGSGQHHRSCHSELLRKHGLPVRIGDAAAQLGISVATLRQRINRNRKNFLRPLRKYGPRQDDKPLQLSRQ
jgi:hypothetical protein